MIDSAYARAAVLALNRWNKISLEEAQEFVATHSREEVEAKSYAGDSVKSGFEALVDAFKNMGMEIPDKQKDSLYSVILDGPIDSPVMEQFKANLGQIDKETLALDALTAIHDNWVKKYERKIDRPDREFMHTPLEMLGWETVESDYVFLKSVMDCIGASIEDEQSLIAKYNDRQVQYFQRNGITDKDSLAAHIKTLPDIYEPLVGYSTEHKKRFDEPVFADQVYSETKFEDLMATRSVEQKSSLGKKAAELQEILDGQKKLENIPLPERAKAKEMSSYGE